jgi:hypothetical protein
MGYCAAFTKWINIIALLYGLLPCEFSIIAEVVSESVVIGRERENPRSLNLYMRGEGKLWDKLGKRWS